MSERLTDAAIREAMARAEKATRGPWRVQDDGYCVFMADADGGAYITDDSQTTLEDSTFIAAARTDVPALAAECLARGEEVARLTRALGWAIPLAYERIGGCGRWTPMIPTEGIPRVDQEQLDEAEAAYRAATEPTTNETHPALVAAPQPQTPLGSSPRPMRAVRGACATRREPNGYCNEMCRDMGSCIYEDAEGLATVVLKSRPMTAIELTLTVLLLCALLFVVVIAIEARR